MTDWRETLNSFLEKNEESKLKKEEESDLTRFVANIVMPAFEQVTPELEQHGRYVTIRNQGTSAAMRVEHNGEEELLYCVRGRVLPTNIVPYAEVRYRERKGLKLIRMESMIRSGPSDYSLANVTSEEIIQDFLKNYMKRVKLV